MKPSLTRERVDRALDAAAKVFEVPRRELAGRCRVKSVARARMAVYSALYQSFETSSVEIGWRLQRDHSTVLHGLAQAEERAMVDPDYADRVRLIMTAAQSGIVQRRAA
jgi:chromosomal replication initiation ATPase DnaA